MLDAHLGAGGLRPLPRERLRRFLTLLGRGQDSAELEQEALALIEPLGVGVPAVQDELATLVAHAQAAGMDLEHAIPVGQAYVRALGRIVEAEVAHLRAMLREVEPERRVEVLDRLLPEVVGASSRGFDVLHRSLLQSALLEELSPDDARRGEDGVLAVALVDLSGSTRYLERASATETEALVDGLFETGQAAAAAHGVRVVKYVGDGFFLAGRRPSAVVGASLDAVAEIGRTLPLPARAGVTAGRVVRRSGDLFGLPVNIAQILTKAAAPGEVVTTEELAATLPDSLARTRRAAPAPRGGAALHVVVLETARP